MYFVIGADIVPTKSDTDNFIKGDMSGILSDKTLEVLDNAEFRIFNLETPLYDGNTPIKKAGPNLSAGCDTINGFKSIKTDLLTLANNHIMDHGKEGLKSTIACLEDAQIDHVGAGYNITEAEKPFFFNFAGKKIGVYACAEHEFSIAADELPGANPVDLLEIFDHIQQIKSRCDYVIVLYHGGKEYYRYPSPSLRKICRKLSDKGADLILAQHSHCVGCKEDYNGSTIVYGQGNFLFDLNHNEFWNEGLLVKVDEDLQVSFVPLRECDLSGFYKRSEEIKETGFVEKEYAAFASKMYEQQTSPFRKKEGILFKVINKVSGNKLRNRRIYDVPEDKLYARINFVECEAHRELLIEGIKETLNKRGNNIGK